MIENRRKALFDANSKIILNVRVYMILNGFWSAELAPSITSPLIWLPSHFDNATTSNTCAAATVLLF